MARVPMTSEQVSTGKLVLNVENVGITPEQFDRLCGDNPDLRIEFTARKEIVIMSPTYSKTGKQNAEITMQLGVWAKRDGRGVVFDSNAGFTFPDGATLSPDASWIRRERWEALTAEQQDSFAPVCPDFVLELRSHTNTLSELQEKMSGYLSNGAKLGFLIDPFDQLVYIYRTGQAPERLNRPASVSGDPVLPGFTLDLTEIWQ